MTVSVNESGASLNFTTISRTKYVVMSTVVQFVGLFSNEIIFHQLLVSLWITSMPVMSQDGFG